MSETNMEYNMDHMDELQLVDLRASMRADITKVMDEVIQCREIISNIKLAVNPYLRSVYSEVTTRLQDLITNWERWFPGEAAIKVVMTEGVMQE